MSIMIGRLHGDRYEQLELLIWKIVYFTVVLRGSFSLSTSLLKPRYGFFDSRFLDRGNREL